MDIILVLMVSSVALVLGFGLVMAIDLNKWINEEVRNETKQQKEKHEHTKFI